MNHRKTAERDSPDKLRHSLLPPISKIQSNLFMAGKELEAGRDSLVKVRLQEIEKLVSDLAVKIEQHIDTITRTGRS